MTPAMFGIAEKLLSGLLILFIGVFLWK